MQIKIIFLLAPLGLILYGRATAQTFKVIHSFDGNGGAQPTCGLISSGDRLYGVTYAGGSGSGTVFGINTDGTGFTNLHTFAAFTGTYPFFTNSDGAFPHGGLLLSGDTLYGTTLFGGDAGVGAIFKVGVDGSGFTNLHFFTAGVLNGTAMGSVLTNYDGIRPFEGLTLSGTRLYGTTVGGGILGYGTVFAVNVDGTGFSSLYSFPAPSGSVLSGAGDQPKCRLALAGNNLYGTTYNGGAVGRGTVFAIGTYGGGIAIVHSFTGFTQPSAVSSDGAFPADGLSLSGNTLYGTTVDGGIWGVGTAFRLNTDGSAFTILHSFAGPPTEGTYPGSLSVSGNMLYGTTWAGGSWDYGTIFALSTDGTEFIKLYNFTADANNQGTFVSGSVIVVGRALYGTTGSGGDYNNGTVFSLSFTPQLTLIPSGPNLILTWPTNYAGLDYTGYKLQSTTNLVSSVWTTNLPPLGVINGQNTVTNPITGTQQFFRLSE